MSENKGLPGDNSETGVLDGVGLCPGGRKCDGDPLFEPPPNLKTNILVKFVNDRALSETYLHEDSDVKDYGFLDFH